MKISTFPTFPVKLHKIPSDAIIQYTLLDLFIVDQKFTSDEILLRSTAHVRGVETLTPDN